MTTSDKALSISPKASPQPLPAGPALSRPFVLIAAGLIGVAGFLVLRGQAGGLHMHGPNLALLAAQPIAVKLHLATVLPAFLIGCILMAGMKGTTLHRALGWAWVLLMTTTAVISFFIHEVNPHGFSPIHALSAWVAVAAPFGLYLARRGKTVAHRRMMTGLFLFGLLVAGAFTFIPGRVMYQLFFG